LCYTIFDLKRRTVTLANSGVPYPIRASGETVEEIDLPGFPLGSFPGVTYDEKTVPLERDDLYVFCSDGVNEAMNNRAEEFGTERLHDVIRRNRHLTPKAIVDAIVLSVNDHRAGTPPNDDTTVVVLKFS
jgi:sigma-B regulation protein RsbU (phosphoserine phosphatase)